MKTQTSIENLSLPSTDLWSLEYNRLSSLGFSQSEERKDENFYSKENIQRSLKELSIEKRNIQEEFRKRIKEDEKKILKAKKFIKNIDLKIEKLEGEDNEIEKKVKNQKFIRIEGLKSALKPLVDSMEIIETSKDDVSKLLELASNKLIELESLCDEQTKELAEKSKLKTKIFEEQQNIQAKIEEIKKENL